MKSKDELKDLLEFICEYATYMLGSGVHTSRVVRCARRVGASQGVEVHFSTFQKSTILSVRDDSSREVLTQVAAIPHLPISFQRNADLGTLSWEALDEGLSLEAIKERFARAKSKAPIPPHLVLATVGLANASFCRLFGGDWTAVGLVFLSTLLGFAVKQQLQQRKMHHFLVFILSAFIASLGASISLLYPCTSEIALATSVLFLVPGVPLINGIIDIVEGHILIGFSRLVNALLLIICLAMGLSATLMLVKDGLL